MPRLRGAGGGAGGGSPESVAHTPRMSAAAPTRPAPQELASERPRGSASVHVPGDYWRVMRQASELAAMGARAVHVVYMLCMLCMLCMLS